jgi:cysteine desulfuration protein SufE
MSQSIEEMEAYLLETAEELNDLQTMDVMEMYRHLTDLGKALPELPAEERVPENFVQGCTSNVYIAASRMDGRLVFRGSSEAHIIRGYVAILVTALSGLSPNDLLAGSQSAIEKFADSTNIRATLTPSRANAFGNIYKLMRQKAKALVG